MILNWWNQTDLNRRPGDYAYHYNFRYPLSVWFVVWTLSSLITKCVPSSLYTLLLVRNLGSVLACLKPSPNLTHSMYYDIVHNTQPIKYKDNYFMLFCLLCGKQLTGKQSKFAVVNICWNIITLIFKAMHNRRFVLYLVNES